MKYSLFCAVVLISCGSSLLEPCTVADNEDGTYTLACPDGSRVVVKDGGSGLLRQESEGPGSNCPTGGVKLMFGIDTGPLDGILQDGEVSSTGYSCHGGCTVINNASTKTVTCSDGSNVKISVPETLTLHGDFTVTNSAELVLLNMYDTVEGYVQIQGGVRSVSLPNLVAISDYLFINNSLAQSIEMNSLEFVGTDFVVQNNLDVQSLSFGSLTSVESTFRVFGNPLLPECEVNQLYTQLQNYQGTVDISNNNTTAICN